MVRIELAHSHCIVAARGSKHGEARGLCASQFAVITVVCSGGRKGLDCRSSSGEGFRPSVGGIRCPLGLFVAACSLVATPSGVLPCSIVVFLVAHSTVASRVVALHSVVVIREYVEYKDIVNIVSLFFINRI